MSKNFDLIAQIQSVNSLFVLFEDTERRGLRFFDTVEVCGSSPHGPTIFFSELASPTSPGKAPNGPIKEVVRDSQGSSSLWAQTDEKDAPAS
jgi:hypothetical protein